MWLFSLIATMFMSQSFYYVSVLFGGRGRTLNIACCRPPPLWSKFLVSDSRAKYVCKETEAEKLNTILKFVDSEHDGLSDRYQLLHLQCEKNTTFFKKNPYNTVQRFTTLIESSGRQALQAGRWCALPSKSVFQGWAMCVNKAEHENRWKLLPTGKWWWLLALSRLVLHGASVCPNEYYYLYVLCAPYLTFSHIIFSLIAFKL
jgi:hypothetical protein